MEELFYKIFVLSDSVFVVSVLLFCFFFLLKIAKQRTAFSTKVFIPKKCYFLFARFFMIADFQRVSIVCALALLTKVLNVCFGPVIEFTYSYAIHEKVEVRAISVFQEKLDVEFTRQAVNCSIQFCLKLVCTPQQRVMHSY